MKKLMIIVLLSLGLESLGQVPVFNYTNPSKETLLAFAKRNSTKDVAYRNYLIKIVAIKLDTNLQKDTNSVNWIFDRLFLEEIYLEDGNYENSGYNKSTGKMQPSIGHRWTGFAWVFRYKGKVFSLIKGDCGNILNVKEEKVVVEQKTVQTQDATENQNNNQNQKVENSTQGNSDNGNNHSTSNNGTGGYYYGGYYYGYSNSNSTPPPQGCNNCGNDGPTTIFVSSPPPIVLVANFHGPRHYHHR